AVRELEAGAPKRVAAGRVTAVAPQGPWPAEVPIALHRHASIRCAARELDRGREVGTERRRDAHRAAHAPEPISPDAAVEAPLGGPLRPLGIDPPLRAHRERG